MAEISMSGLCTSWVKQGESGGCVFHQVVTETDQPWEGCFLSQSAHWPVQVGSYFAMGSGPACLLNRTLGLSEKYGFGEKADHAVLVLETGQIPDDLICRQLALDCGVDPGQLALVVAPTSSLAGRIQVAARSVETALHKLAYLGFDLHRVVQGKGICPLAPETSDDFEALGLTNDVMIVGSQVWLEILGVSDDELTKLVKLIPSQTSPSYGEPFLKAIKAAGGFYNLDPGLFAPAEITLTNQESGKVFHSGAVNTGRIAEILGG
jgi:methenyltetrahydromethanopterin cyclohydrolase